MTCRDVVYIQHLGLVHATGDVAVDCLLRELQRLSEEWDDAQAEVRRAETDAKDAATKAMLLRGKVAAIEGSLGVLGRPPQLVDTSKAAA